MNSHSLSRIEQCRIVELPRIKDENGSLTFLQNTPDALFNIKRVFYLYDIPGDSERGGHSHHRAQEIIVALSGSFDVTLHDGHTSRCFTLNRPYQGLYIPAGIWRGLDNFSSGSVCLVLTSEKFEEADYVRQFSRFLELTAHKVTP